jgi:hypothetical protein
MARIYGKTEIVPVTGKLSWVFTVGLNRFEKWSVTIHPNQESLEKIRDLQSEGLKNVIKKDEDGYYVQFSRPPHKETQNGKIISFAPPVVTDRAGNPVDGRVGNGSDGTVELEVYEHPTPQGGKAKAARLRGIIVDNLIPFNPDTDYRGETAEIVQSLRSQPEQTFER